MTSGAIALVLVGSGAALALIGIWRGYASARRAVAPLIHAGEPTRSLIEATRPLPMRPRVRAFASRVAFAIAWLALALYGLYLAMTGTAWLA